MTVVAALGAREHVLGSVEVVRNGCECVEDAFAGKMSTECALDLESCVKTLCRASLRW